VGLITDPSRSSSLGTDNEVYPLCGKGVKLIRQNHDMEDLHYRCMNKGSMAFFSRRLQIFIGSTMVTKLARRWNTPTHEENHCSDYREVTLHHLPSITSTCFSGLSGKDFQGTLKCFSPVAKPGPAQKSRAICCKDGRISIRTEDLSALPHFWI